MRLHRKLRVPELVKNFRARGYICCISPVNIGFSPTKQQLKPETILRNDSLAMCSYSSYLNWLSIR